VSKGSEIVNLATFRAMTLPLNAYQHRVLAAAASEAGVSIETLVRRTLQHRMGTLEGRAAAARTPDYTKIEPHKLIIDEVGEGIKQGENPWSLRGSCGPRGEWGDEKIEEAIDTLLWLGVLDTNENIRGEEIVGLRTLVEAYEQSGAAERDFLAAERRRAARQDTDSTAS